MKISLNIGIIIVMALLGGCFGTDNNEDKLLMGTSLDYPPFEYSEYGEAKGFDIDVAKAICDELGVELEVRDISFEGLFGAMNSGTVDFVMAGLSWTEDRAQSVDFSDVYYEADEFVLIVKAENIGKLKTVSGKRIGTQQGSLMEASLKEQEDVDILALGRNPQLIEELKLGRVEAVMIGKPQAEAYVKASNGVLAMDTLPYESEEGGVSVTFKKGSELRTEFNKALEKLKENGKLAELKAKWFN